MGCRNTKRYACKADEPYTQVNQDGLEDSITDELFKEFFTRLNAIKNLHVQYDKKQVPKKQNLPTDYWTDYNAAGYITHDEKVPVNSIIQNLNQDSKKAYLIKNVQSAMDNLIQNIPKITNVAKDGATGAYGTIYKKADLTTATQSLDLNSFVKKEQYNLISQNIRFLEEICAHNTDNAHNGNAPSYDNSSGGGGGNSNGYSPHYGGNSNCASHSQSGCSNHCGGYYNSNVCPQQGKSCGNSNNSFSSYHYNS